MGTRSDILEFKSATLYALRIVLYTSDTPALLQTLDDRIREAGAFYENEPVILDAQGLDQAPDWKALVAAMRKHHLHPIGVQTDPALQTSALKAGLPPLDASASRSAGPAGAPRDLPAPPPAADDPAPASQESPLALSASQTLVIRHPLRSGQRIYAKGGDLIVMAQVSQGAEVIADGHIHVYGPLRGKAMAGAQGRTDAMILTTQLDPELLAIAGVYRVVETQLPKTLHNQAARITLDGDTLRIQAL
ncbi:MAG: septum site-determining protein MinC [Castellaniella sp.]|uniref:septum site-determining protein MinC n=1 Tax=Castellaniella sp. TaxID=1955812 RepID=UPI003C76F8A4